MIELNRKRSREILKELRNRIEAGERFTTQKIMDEFLAPRTPFDYLLAKEKAKNWLCALSVSYRNQGKTFKTINDQLEHGFPETESEYKYYSTRGLKVVKGIVNSQTIAMNEGLHRGLITPIEESIAVLKMPSDEKKTVKTLNPSNEKISASPAR